jgi:two-component system, chemotaxis family, response regulator Rcp1
MAISRDGLNIVEVLLVEDNRGDIRLIQETMKDARLLSSIIVAEDGQKAIDLLMERKATQPMSLPDIILLDLNLPKKNGFEVLEAVRADPVLTSIPVIMLTTSQAERDVMMSYKLHANAFVSKPVDLSEFIDVVRKTTDFWFTIVRYPSKDVK